MTSYIRKLVRLNMTRSLFFILKYSFTFTYQNIKSSFWCAHNRLKLLLCFVSGYISRCVLHYALKLNDLKQETIDMSAVHMSTINMLNVHIRSYLSTGPMSTIYISFPCRPLLYISFPGRPLIYISFPCRPLIYLSFPGRPLICLPFSYVYRLHVDNQQVTISMSIISMSTVPMSIVHVSTVHLLTFIILFPYRPLINQHYRWCTFMSTVYMSIVCLFGFFLYFYYSGLSHYQKPYSDYCNCLSY